MKDSNEEGETKSKEARLRRDIGVSCSVIVNLEVELRDCQEREEKLLQDAVNMDKIIEALEKEKGEKETKLAKLRAQVGNLDELVTKGEIVALHATAEERARLRKNLLKSEKEEEAEYEEKRRKINDLKNTKAGLNTTIAGMELEIKGAEKNYESLEQDLTRWRTKLDGLRVAQVETQAEAEKLRTPRGQNPIAPLMTLSFPPRFFKKNSKKHQHQHKHLARVLGREKKQEKEKDVDEEREWKRYDRKRRRAGEEDEEEEKAVGGAKRRGDESRQKNFEH